MKTAGHHHLAGRHTMKNGWWEIADIEIGKTYNVKGGALHRVLAKSGRGRNRSIQTETTDGKIVVTNWHNARRFARDVLFEHVGQAAG